MRIGTVVTATDANPLYIEFIPMFVKAWKKVLPEADIIILLIADSIPDIYLPYKDYIKLVKPIPGIHTAFHAQCIRLLYPREVERNTEAVIITDMDVLLPVEIPMCYVAALPFIWKSVFGTEGSETLLRQWYQYSNYSGNHGGTGWNTDQLILTRMFKLWGGKKVVLNDSITKFNRLDRSDIHRFYQSNIELLKEKIKAGEYSDYHCLRPYSNFTELNNFIVDSL
jgi:hypothetical protein